MAPIGDNTVQGLQDLVNRLEERVKQLEDKLHHAQGHSPAASAESVRMILIGPPGAGKRLLDFLRLIEPRLILRSQARALKLPTSRRNSHAAIWYVYQGQYNL